MPPVDGHLRSKYQSPCRIFWVQVLQSLMSEGREAMGCKRVAHVSAFRLVTCCSNLMMWMMELCSALRMLCNYCLLTKLVGL